MTLQSISNNQLNQGHPGHLTSYIILTNTGEVVLPNGPSKLIQLHQQIRFTSTTTAEAATTTVVPNAPIVVCKRRSQSCPWR
jgi:hypothetical protein